MGDAEGSAKTGAALRQIGRLFHALGSMTPGGDAARSWVPIFIAFAVTYALFPDYPFGQETFLPTLFFLDLFYGLFLLLTWVAMYGTSPEELRLWALAQRSHASGWRWLLDVLKSTRVFSGRAGLIMIVSFSFVGVFSALALLPEGGRLGVEAIRVPLCVLGVVTSWALLHTAYALYYAHLFYGGARPEGFAFPGDEQPGPSDFAYFAFTLGTSFAVSDVQITARRIRRVALGHSVLSFFYNTAILALVLDLALGGT